MTYLITLAFSIWFFLESIFWLAWTIISFWILWFFVDIKTLIFLWVFAWMIASIFILISDYKSFSKEHFFKMILPALPWCLLWAFLVDRLSSMLLLKIFSLFLIFYSLNSLFWKNINFNNITKNILLFFSWILWWLFWTWWPFAVMAMSNDFKYKSQLRSTFAVFFILYNIVRGLQYQIQWTFDFIEIKEYWIVFIPMILAIFLWHKIHIRISENNFKKWIWILLFIAWISFLFK